MLSLMGSTTKPFSYQTQTNSIMFYVANNQTIVACTYVNVLRCILKRKYKLTVSHVIIVIRSFVRTPVAAELVNIL